MGPRIQAQYGAFTTDISLSFNGHNPYAVYRQDAELWLISTKLDPSKSGLALIGCLSGEANSSAITIGADVIDSITGATIFLDHWNKSYSIDTVDQLENYLAAFLDYTWKGNISMEQYIVGFHSRLDRMYNLAMDYELKGHLLLLQADLDDHTRNMVVGAASGEYLRNYLHQ